MAARTAVRRASSPCRCSGVSVIVSVDAVERPHRLVLDPRDADGAIGGGGVGGGHKRRRQTPPRGAVIGLPPRTPPSARSSPAGCRAGRATRTAGRIPAARTHSRACPRRRRARRSARTRRGARRCGNAAVPPVARARPFRSGSAVDARRTMRAVGAARPRNAAQDHAERRGERTEHPAGILRLGRCGNEMRRQYERERRNDDGLAGPHDCLRPYNGLTLDQVPRMQRRDAAFRAAIFTARGCCGARASRLTMPIESTRTRAAEVR